MRERKNWCLVNKGGNAGDGNGSKEEKRSLKAGGEEEEEEEAALTTIIFKSASPPMPRMGIVVFLIFQYSDPTLPRALNPSCDGAMSSMVVVAKIWWSSMSYGTKEG